MMDFPMVQTLPERWLQVQHLLFFGRAFMYGVTALGAECGVHTISILKTQLQQVMEQICCERTIDSPNFIKK